MAIDLGELSKSTCIQCGSEAYKHRERVYKLCVLCGWKVIVELLDYGESEDKSIKDNTE